LIISEEPRLFNREGKAEKSRKGWLQHRREGHHYNDEKKKAAIPELYADKEDLLASARRHLSPPVDKQALTSTRDVNTGETVALLYW